MRTAYAFLFFLCVTFFLFSEVHAFSYEDEKIQFDKKYKTVLDQFNQNLTEGNWDVAIDNFSNGIPEKERSAITYLMMGDTIDNLDFNYSYQLHKKAYQMDSTNYDIAFGYAIALHRNKEYKNAIRLYEQIVDSFPTQKRMYALIADCYLHINDPIKSIVNWKRSDHSSNYIDIEDAICVIYFKENPTRKRCDIWNQIRKGNLDKINDLIILDLTWKTDWWNTSINNLTLDFDLKEAKKLLKENSDYKNLEELALYRQEKISAEEYHKYLQKSNIVVSSYKVVRSRLPENTLLASYIISDCIELNFCTILDLYQKFSADLMKRTMDKKDPEALNIYCYLNLSGNGSHTLNEDSLGWKMFHETRFVESYFYGQQTDGKLKLTDKEFQAALEEFPNSNLLNKMAYELCEKTNNKEKINYYLTRLIEAEYTSLNSNNMGSKNSLGLKSYFQDLEESFSAK